MYNMYSIYNLQTGSSMRSIEDCRHIEITIPSYRLQAYGSDSHYEYEVKVIYFSFLVYLIATYCNGKSLIKQSVYTVNCFLFTRN